MEIANKLLSFTWQQKWDLLKNAADQLLLITDQHRHEEN